MERERVIDGEWGEFGDSRIGGRRPRAVYIKPVRGFHSTVCISSHARAIGNRKLCKKHQQNTQLHHEEVIIASISLLGICSCCLFTSQLTATTLHQYKSRAFINVTEFETSQ